MIWHDALSCVSSSATGCSDALSSESRKNTLFRFIVRGHRSRAPSCQGFINFSIRSMGQYQFFHWNCSGNYNNRTKSVCVARKGCFACVFCNSHTLFRMLSFCCFAFIDLGLSERVHSFTFLHEIRPKLVCSTLHHPEHFFPEISGSPFGPQKSVVATNKLALFFGSRCWLFVKPLWSEIEWLIVGPICGLRSLHLD